MDYGTVDPHFRQNLDALIHFPKNNNAAEIKAGKDGGLYLKGGEATLEQTAVVIERTCRDIIFDMDKSIQQAKESGNYEKMVNARECCLKAEEALKGLKEIQRVYSERYQDKDNQGINDLTGIVNSFEQNLNRFKEAENEIEEKIHLATNEIFKEFEEGSISSDASEEALSENIVKASSWFSTFGKGPTALGKFLSGVNTVKELAIGAFWSYSYTASSDPMYLKGQQRVANAGRQLSGIDVYSYIEGLENKASFNSINDFYLMPGSEINSKTLGGIKAKLLERYQNFKDPNQPLVIPITFGGEGIWERNHIALILVKDNCVEYYDAKGILSENKQLAEENDTLRDVLEFCKDTFTKDGNIIENPYPHQFDAHNCGVFVCRHLDERLVKNVPVGTLYVNPPSLSEVEDFREEIIKVAYPQ